jgi:hypothetical protein
MAAALLPSSNISNSAPVSDATIGYVRATDLLGSASCFYDGLRSYTLPLPCASCRGTQSCNVIEASFIPRIFEVYIEYAADLNRPGSLAPLVSYKHAGLSCSSTALR